MASMLENFGFELQLASTCLVTMPGLGPTERIHHMYTMQNIYTLSHKKLGH